MFCYVDVTDKRIGRLMYIIKVPKTTVKIHYRHIRKRYMDDTNNGKKKSMKVIYDLYGVPMIGRETFEQTKKRKIKDYANKPQKKKIYIFQRKFKKMVCCGVQEHPTTRRTDLKRKTARPFTESVKGE